MIFFLLTLFNGCWFFLTTGESQEDPVDMTVCIIEEQIAAPLTENPTIIKETQEYSPCSYSTQDWADLPYVLENNATSTISEEENFVPMTTFLLESDQRDADYFTSGLPENVPDSSDQLKFFQFNPSSILPENMIIEQIPIDSDALIIKPNFLPTPSYHQQKAFFEQLEDHLNKSNADSIIIIDHQQTYQLPSFHPFDRSFIPPNPFDRGAQYLRQAAELIQLNAPHTPVSLFLKDAQGQWIPIPHYSTYP